jgi:hypothetical protein
MERTPALVNDSAKLRNSPCGIDQRLRAAHRFACGDYNQCFARDGDTERRELLECETQVTFSGFETVRNLRMVPLIETHCADQDLKGTKKSRCRAVVIAQSGRIAYSRRVFGAKNRRAVWRLRSTDGF